MEYVVYCDESRRDGSEQNPFMSVGGLWLPRSLKPELTRQFREWRFSSAYPAPAADIRRYLATRRACQKKAPRD